MKRLLMYIVVAIVLVSMGFSIYYVVRDDEEIYSLVADNEIFYINEGETLSLPIVRNDPASDSDFLITSKGYDAYVDVDLDEWTITGLHAGMVEISFASTNDKFSENTYKINCYVGNGSEKYPYYIRNEQDLLKIGDEEWTLTDNYELTTDITLSQPIMPIGVSYASGKYQAMEFNGSFTGGNLRHSIKNIKIIQGDLDFPVAGFFAKIGDLGKVESVVFEDVYVEGRFSYAGSVAGVNYGLIGMCEIKNAEIINNYQNGFTGGICGLNERKAGSDNFAQVNICTSNAKITSKWVAGGAVGYNYGGVIFNCLVKTDSLNLSVVEGADSTYSYFGGLAGISNCGVEGENYYDSYVSNSIAYIANVAVTSSHIAGIFGSYYGISGAYASEGNYNMLFYVADSTLKPYYLFDDDQILSDKNPNTAQNYAKQISHEEACKQKTYTSIPNNKWDFDNVWEIEEGVAIRLGYVRIDGEEMEYQAFSSNGGVVEISTDEQLIEAFDTMRSKPSKNIIYEVSQSVTFDGEDGAWEPIGGAGRPFQGQFVMDDDVTITIKNVTINSDYAGIFGYVEGNNTIIKNIIVDGAIINGTVAGVIAGSNNGGTIENCQVLNYEIYTQKYAGAIAGYNGGTISNCLVSAQEATDENGETQCDELGNTIYQAAGEGGYIKLSENSEQSIYLGGVAGKSTGTVSAVKVFKNDFNFDSQDYTKVVYTGGAVGQNQGNINDVDINFYTAKAQDFDGKAYVGGIVGHQSAGKIRSSIVNEANNIMVDINNQNVLAGGIAGFIESGSFVQYSVVGTMTVSAYSVGGFVGVANGTIEQSYVSNLTTLKGRYVGGFTCSLSGTISDCMNAVNLTGSEIEAGMTVYLRKNGKINYCYIDPLFQADTSGEDNILGSLFERKTYAETYSQFRARPDQFGTITNTIIVGNFKTYGAGGITAVTDYKITINGVEALVQTTFATWALDVKAVALQGVIGAAPELKNFGFNEGIWNFELNDVGVYLVPTKAAEVKVCFAAKTNTGTDGAA